MAMSIRRFNWKLLAVILIGLVVLTATAIGLRTWQKNRMATGRLSGGLKAYAAGQWQQAAVDLGKYISIAGGADVPVLLKYADAQLNIRPMKRENVQQAVATYRGILRAEPDNLEAAARLIRLYSDMGMDSESELIARRQLERGPDANFQRMLATALMRQRKFKEAAVQLESIIKSHPDDILSYEAMGTLCEQRPQECGADGRSMLDEAVRKNSSSAMAYIVRGAFSFRQKRTDAAMADFKIAQTLDLSEPDVRLRLARELIAAGQLSLAREHLAAVQSLRSNDILLWQTRAMLASKSGSKPEMIKTAADGLAALSPSHQDFMPAAAKLFIAGGDYDSAVKCIETLERFAAAPGSAAFLRGLLAEHQGQHYQAVHYYYEAIENDTGTGDVEVRLRLAELLSQLGDDQSAIRQMRSLAARQPEFGTARLYLARLLLHGGRPDEAAQYALTLLQNSPTDAETNLIYLQSQMQLFDIRRPDAAQKKLIEKKINELAASAGDTATVQTLRFQYALQCADFDAAAGYLAALQHAAPDDLQTGIFSADLFMAQNKTDAAISVLRKIVEQFPDSVAAARYLAMVLDSVGRPDECRSVLTEAINTAGNSLARRQLQLLLAQMLRHEGKSDQACAMLTELDKQAENDIAVKRELLKFDAVANDPVRSRQLIDAIKSFEGREGTQWRFEQSLLWVKGADFDIHAAQAISLLNENLSADPDDKQSRLLLAMTYEKAGRQREAVIEYREALRRRPYDVQTVIAAVAAMYKSGEYDEADTVMAAVAGRNIEHPILNGYKLQSYLRQGQLQSADEMLNALRAADPNDDTLELYRVTIEMRRNNFEEASRRLALLKVRQPDSLAVFAAMAELHIRQKNKAGAIAVCDEAVQRTNAAQAYVLRGRTYDMFGEVRSAGRDFDRAVEIDAGSGGAWAAKAKFHTLRGQSREAAAAWEKCVALEAANPQIREEAMKFFFRDTDKEMNRRGRKTLESFLAAYPQDTRLQIWQARVLLRDTTSPAFDKAIGILAKVTAEHPSDVEGWSLLGQAWLQNGEAANALDVVMRGLVFVPDNKELLLLKARVEAEHTPELAIPTVKLLRERDPNDADIAIYLATLYGRSGNYKAAIAILDEQLTRGELSLQRQLALARAVALYKSGDKAVAGSLFDALIAGDPNDAAVMRAKAGLFKDEEKWNELAEYVAGWYRDHRGDAGVVVAVVNDLSAGQNIAAKKAGEDILRKAMTTEANSPELLNAYAELLYLSGRPLEAMASYEKLIALYPENLTAINNLAWILCEDIGNPARSLELAQKGLRIEPDYLDLIDTRGMAYFRLGKLEQAIDDFNTCTTLCPSHLPSAAASYFHLGRAYFASAQKENAMKYLKRALQSNQKTGGLSANDAAEAQNLLDGLLKG